MDQGMPNENKAQHDERITVCFIELLLFLAEWSFHSEHHFAPGASQTLQVRG